MRAAITGSSGLIGGAAGEMLAGRGWTLTRVVRSAAASAPGRVTWQPEADRIDRAGLEAHDLVIHAAGEPIAGLWTPAKKRRIEQSRIEGTRLLSEALASLSAKPRLLVSISASGFYGDRDPAEPMTEDKPAGSGFLAEVCVRWEAATRAAEDAGIRVVHARLGNVMSPKGGILEVLKPIFRLGLGARFGSGEQIWPWIALADVTGAILHVIEHDALRGAVNFVAPEAVTNAELTRALAKALNRPSFAIPSWAVRLAPGGMGEDMLLGGARVVPQRLRDSGYRFRFPALREALQAVL